MTKKQSVVVMNEKQNWAELQDLLQNAVVQVFAQIARFDWLEPYQVTEQFESRGSGFLINADGYFITNAHVVHEAARVWIHLPLLGRKNIQAEIVGVCPDRDIALLRIVPGDLDLVVSLLRQVPFLIFGDSDFVKRTDDVLVLGYPLGQFRLKSGTGIVSGREVEAGQALIQITAPINPGSSGGPLINSQGAVIGIAVAAAVDAQNVGYAIPINELILILDDLYKKKLVRKPFLGARFVYSSDEKAQFLGNPMPAGLYITRIFKNSLLAKAGVQAGDMIYEFNGYVIDAHGETVAPWGNDKTTLGDLVSRVQIGQEVELIIYRNGERKKIRFDFEVRKLAPIRIRYPDCEGISYEIIAGMVIMELADNHFPDLLPIAPDLIPYTQIKNKHQSVLVVTHVIPGSAAQQLRSIVEGDIICEVNGKRVRTLERFRKLLRISLADNFLRFKTCRDVFAVFDLKHVLEDEKRLSRDFVYPMSKMVHRLINAVNKKEKS